MTGERSNFVPQKVKMAELRRYLWGRHLQDLVNVLQRAGDVPQRRLVGQLLSTCTYREKGDFFFKCYAATSL